MKIETALILAFAFFGCGKKQASEWELKEEKYAETGIVSARYWLKNGKKDSIMTVFDSKGIKSGEIRFRDDKQDGRTVYFFPDGKLREEQWLKAGKREGIITVFYENGQKSSESEYHGDKLNGFFKKWSPTGELVLDAVFANDTLQKTNVQKLFK